MFHPIKRIHQIIINDSGSLPDVLSDRVKDNFSSIKSIYPDASYHLWNGNQCREMIKNNFDCDVLEAFDGLVPYAYKADLARYCILYIYGGIYADISVKMQNVWKIPFQYKIAAFSQLYDNMDLWVNLMQSLIWSQPGRRELYLAISMIVKHFKNKFYGMHDHYVTGPALLGYCFAKTITEQSLDNRYDEQYVGKVRFINPEKDLHRTCYIAPDRTMVATRYKKISGDIKELGISDGNSYPDIWRKKKVFGERNSFWESRDAMILVCPDALKEVGGIYIKASRKKRICYGPYIDLKSGSYTIESVWSVKKFKMGCLVLEISYNTSHEVYARKRKFFIGKHGNIFLKNSLRVGKDLKLVEFRYQVPAGFEGYLKSIKLIESDF